MRDKGRRIANRAALALACLAATGLPAFAASRSVVLSDGSTLTVWDQQGRARPGRAPESWSIRYAVTDLAGTRTGVVPPTADGARDSSPYLAKDATGSAVVVWSRFDGSYRKIAYARFSGDAWTGFRYLTFGPGDDDAPRIGSGRTGSFLFYVTQAGRYQFAPFDPRTGYLFAAPRPINLGSARRDIDPLLSSAPFTTQAGVDIPVVGLKPGEKRNGGNASLFRLGDSTVQGGLDTPVTWGHHKASVWGVGSDDDCARMVLVISSHNQKSAYVFRFDFGATSVLQRITLPPQVDDLFGENLAASYLPLVCD